MAYLRYSKNSDWYVFAENQKSGAEARLAIWHSAHRVSAPSFSLADVRAMILADDLSRIPGYERRYHDQLVAAMKEFIEDEARAVS